MSEDQSNKNAPDKKRHPVASLVVGLVGLACGAYLANPTLGVFELIPDNVPGVGNLDEAGAAAILISCLAYFGLDLGALFGRKPKEEPKTAKGDVIDT